MQNPKRKIINQKPKIIFLVGPTAVGKTDIAIEFAKKLGAEIVSCDSMQIYQGMGIITSTPAASLTKKIRHHLIGMVSPAREYNVSRYRSQAMRKIKDILKRGKVPLLVGGSGLYMSILVNGIFKARSQNKNIRQRLYEQAGQRGSGYLYKRLQKVDAKAASKIHPHDTRRIIRALEVFEATGKPISELQRERQGLTKKYDVNIFCLTLPRDKLYRKIDERIEKMFQLGLVEEIRKLLKLRLSKTASCAIGIKELKGYFEGLYDLEEAKRLIKRNTRLYAKRQLTWFRKDKRIKWIEADEKGTNELLRWSTHY